MLAWQKPLEKNGPSLYFDIWFNDEHVLIQPNATELIYPVESNNNEIFYEICNLLSYTNYVISILACTISCSEATESLRVQTKVGGKFELNFSFKLFYTIYSLFCSSW